MGWFELGGFEGREIEDQMQLFAEEVMPVIARECGGKVELPERGINYGVLNRRRQRWPASKANNSSPSTRAGSPPWGPIRRCRWMSCGRCSNIGAMSRPNPAASITSRPMPAAFRHYGRCRKVVLRTAYCCARTAAATSPDRCTRIARCMDTSPRRSDAER